MYSQVKRPFQVQLFSTLLSPLGWNVWQPEAIGWCVEIILKNDDLARIPKELLSSRPSCSISHKISKSDCSGSEPVICDSAQHTTWVALSPSTPTTNNTPTQCPRQTTQYLSTGIKRTEKLEEKKFSKKLEHIKLIMGGWVGTTRFTHLDYHGWSETTCTLAYIRCHVSSARQPVS